MNARLLWIPIALLGAVLFVATPEAAAAAAPPQSPLAGADVQFGPRIYVGGHIGVPVGGRSYVRRSGGYYREEVSYTGGYYVTKTREVEVPGAQIGWDFAGKPIYGASTVKVQRYRVWIPRKRIVRRVWVPYREVRIRRRPFGHIGIGGRIRLR